MAESQAISVALWSSDIEALASFLEAVAGMTAAERHPGYARLEHGGASLILHGDEAFRGHPWFDALQRQGAARGIGAEVRIAVSDVAAAHQRAMAQGAASIVAPYDSGQGLECQVMGPDGYLFVLHSGMGENQ